MGPCDFSSEVKVLPLQIAIKLEDPDLVKELCHCGADPGKVSKIY